MSKPSPDQPLPSSSSPAASDAPLGGDLSDVEGVVPHAAGPSDDSLAKARTWPWVGVLVLALVLVGVFVANSARSPNQTVVPPPASLSDSIFTPNGVVRPQSGAVTWELVIPPDASSYGTEVFNSVPALRGKSSTVVLMKVGDELVVRNDDDIVHYIGPFTVRPGETLRHTFAGRSTLLSGSCSFVADTITFDVTA